MSSSEALQRFQITQPVKTIEEPKGTLVNIPVVIKGVEMLCYVMRMGEKMPAFNYWPRGREIIHRLIMRAAMTDNLDDFHL